MRRKNGFANGPGLWPTPRRYRGSYRTWLDGARAGNGGWHGDNKVAPAQDDRKGSYLLYYLVAGTTAGSANFLGRPLITPYVCATSYSDLVSSIGLQSPTI